MYIKKIDAQPYIQKNQPILMKFSQEMPDIVPYLPAMGIVHHTTLKPLGVYFVREAKQLISVNKQILKGDPFC
jgi:hypothetical protein